MMKFVRRLQKLEGSKLSVAGGGQFDYQIMYAVVSPEVDDVDAEVN